MHWLWPNIDSVVTANIVIRRAFWASMLIAGATLAFATLAVIGSALPTRLGIGGLAVFDAAVFGAIALGLWTRSRFAAWAGLSFYLIEIAAGAAELGRPPNPILPIIFSSVFVNGIRATSWLRKHAPAPSFDEVNSGPSR